MEASRANALGTKPIGYRKYPGLLRGFDEQTADWMRERK
jgi:hypothetical protein